MGLFISITNVILPLLMVAGVVVLLIPAERKVKVNRVCWTILGIVVLGTAHIVVDLSASASHAKESADARREANANR